MNKILALIVLTFILTNAASATQDAPSRSAEKGCAWEKVSDASMGLAAWVQQCDFGFRKIHLYIKQNSLMIHWSDGGDDSALIETFELAPEETPVAGIQRVFAEHTAKTLAARCLLKPYKGDAVPAGVKRYTFVPDAKFQKELDAKQDPNEVPDPPCGDWGDAPDGIQYFEAQPGTGTHRIMFVRVGQDAPLFDEKTLRLLPPVQ
jgi:hypothetical protein